MPTLCRHTTKRPYRLPPGAGLLLLAAALLTGCSTPAANTETSPGPASAERAHLPLLRGWFDGKEVLYVTTDASDAEVAREHLANHVPQLAHALADVPSAAGGNRRPGATSRVYGSTNFRQPSVFASAPEPLGHANRSAAYSPLWQLVKVTWRDPAQARVLRSEEEVLDAADKGFVVLEVTRVVLNCPIVHRGELGVLPGVTVDGRTP
ncbi:hypothetical protein [Acidovorax sp. Root217]|uniref:DUF7482 domain-containing protein n=1 Tax=Acidovorax sp. Root217 TaxID=1736492 RepID=UPI00070F544B|nr:hypothetical protein [Acidovorax sp. Root217]KRC12657.1 hypothetical protein ASE31_10940 [Acidovorax sp. Root217]